MLTADDILNGLAPTTDAKPRAGLDILAAMAELRAVLDALPNSRAELEDLVGQARGALVEIDARLAQAEEQVSGSVDARLAENRQALAEMVDASGRTAFEVAGMAARIVAAEAEIEARCAELDALPAETVEAQVDAVQIEGVRAELMLRADMLGSEVDRLRDELKSAVSDLKAGLDQRFSAYRPGGGGAPPTRVSKAGTLVASRRGLNLIEGTNVTLTVADDGTNDNVNVTIASSGGGAGGFSLPRQAVQTSNFTAAVNKLYPVSTTATAVAAQLATAPADGSLNEFKLEPFGAGHSLTILCGGSDVFNATGGSTTLTVNIGTHQAVGLIYDAASAIWTVLWDDLPIGLLDARFDAAGAAAAVQATLGTLATKSTVASADITDGTIVNADINAAAAIARSKLDFGSGLVSADIAAAAAIPYSKLSLGSSVVSADLVDGTVANADLANMADGTVKGRALGAGSGVPVDLTPTQLRTLAALVIGSNVQAWDADLDTLAANNAGTTTWLAALLNGTYLALAGGTMTGAIAMGSHKITSLTDGAAASDAAAVGQMRAATLRTGGYYFPDGITDVASQAQVLNDMRSGPWSTAASGNCDRIGCRITSTTATAVERLGMHATDATYREPSTVLLDAGTVDASTTGTKEITISQAVVAGTKYGLTGVAQTAAVSCAAITRIAVIGARGNQIASSAVVSATGCFKKTGVTGALVSFDATPTAVDYSDSTICPFVYVRAA